MARSSGARSPVLRPGLRAARGAPSLPWLRMFGLGALAIVACVWALLRDKPDPRTLMRRTPTASGSAVVDGWDDMVEVELLDGR